MNSISKKTAFFGLATAVAMIFSYIEFLFPINLGLPGIKLGLCNAVILFLMYKENIKTAVSVNIIRILLTGILFGNTFGIIYSAVGALFAAAAMITAKKVKCFGIIGVSVFGAVFNNLGQLIAAAALLSTPNVILYLPVLILSGVVFGIITGMVCGTVLHKLK